MTNQEWLDRLNSWHEDGWHGDIAEAIEQLPESERDDEIVSRYGRALNNLGRYSEALQQLLKIEPQRRHDSVWHFRVGYACFFLQQWQEALAAFEKSEKQEPDNEVTLEFIEDSRKMMARHAEAVRELNRMPFRDRDFSHFWERSDYADESYVEAPPTAEYR